jgi:dienelactone hydrolase
MRTTTQLNTTQHHTYKIHPTTMNILYKLSLLLLSCLGYVEPLIIPEPSGPFITGVQDFEFLDTTYPSSQNEDESGRRIMFRAYYPVCNRTDYIEGNNTCGTINLGRRRFYFEENEFEAYFGVSEPTELTSMFVTYSHLNTPIDADMGPIPAVIYAHGAGTWVSDNAALMEELASLGYAVFALGLPGFASGVLYPNGDVVGLDDDFLAALEVPADPLLAESPDIETRYFALKRTLENPDYVASFLPRYRDDMLAMADYLHSNTSGLIRQLVGDGLIYMGYSFGGAAAGSAAHRDANANGAINLDGDHQSTDLLGKPILVPYLTFGSNPTYSFYSNEFFWEELDSMGTDPNVTRVLMPKNTTHSAFTDVKFLPQELLDVLSPGEVAVDGDKLHAIFVDFVLGFVDTHTGQRTDWTPRDSFNKFPDDVESIDVSYVADWAQNNASSKPLTSCALMGSVRSPSLVIFVFSIAFLLTCY